MLIIQIDIFVIICYCTMFNLGFVFYVMSQMYAIAARLNSSESLRAIKFRTTIIWEIHTTFFEEIETLKPI